MFITTLFIIENIWKQKTKSCECINKVLSIQTKDCQLLSHKKEQTNDKFINNKFNNMSEPQKHHAKQTQMQERTHSVILFIEALERAKLICCPGKQISRSRARAECWELIAWGRSPSSKLWWCLQKCKHFSKPFKLYILNRPILLYGNYTSIKLIFKN